jgi:glycine cleavage system H protein
MKLYTATHQWLSFSDSYVTIGITNWAKNLLGEIKFVELPEIGHRYSTGENIGFIEATTTASDIHTPVSGEVIELNHMIDDCGAINADPEGNGWIFKIKPDDIDYRDPSWMNYETYTYYAK